MKIAERAMKQHRITFPSSAHHPLLLHPLQNSSTYTTVPTIAQAISPTSHFPRDASHWFNLSSQPSTSPAQTDAHSWPGRPVCPAHLSLHVRRIDDTREIAIGITPPNQGRRAVLDLEDNVSINQGIAAMGGTRIKTYRVYEKPQVQGTHPPPKVCKRYPRTGTRPRGAAGGPRRCRATPPSSLTDTVYTMTS